MRSAVFLDRDGTMNVRPRDHEYVASEAEFVWLPGAVKGIAALASAGYILTVVSNQRGVARGLVRLSALTAIEKRIQRDLAPYGCAMEVFRYCFHEVAENCDCRKPQPGMIVRLAEELDLDLGSSWIIGDSDSDIRAGQAAGCQTALIGPSPGPGRPDLTAASLAQVSEIIAPRADRIYI